VSSLPGVSQRLLSAIFLDFTAPTKQIHEKNTRKKTNNDSKTRNQRIWSVCNTQQRTSNVVPCSRVRSQRLGSICMAWFASCGRKRRKHSNCLFFFSSSIVSGVSSAVLLSITRMVRDRFIGPPRDPCLQRPIVRIAFPASVGPNSIAHNSLLLFFFLLLVDCDPF
jgi:hypothetical protein